MYVCARRQDEPGRTGPGRAGPRAASGRAGPLARPHVVLYRCTAAHNGGTRRSILPSARERISAPFGDTSGALRPLFPVSRGHARGGCALNALYLLLYKIGTLVKPDKSIMGLQSLLGAH